MAWWNKKKQVVEEPKPIEPPPCKHSYKDFPWYIQINYYSSKHEFDYTIYEPYVCIYCGKRKDVKLYHSDGGHYDKFKDLLTFEKAMYNEYPEMKPRPIVEDMIHDMQLVDKEKLYWYEVMHGQKDVPNKINV